MTRVAATHNALGIFPRRCKRKLTVCYSGAMGKFCQYMDHINDSAFGPVTVLCSAPTTKGKTK